MEARPSLLDLLLQFPLCMPSVSQLLAALPALQHRLYSIANSPCLYVLAFERCIQTNKCGQQPSGRCMDFHSKIDTVSCAFRVVLVCGCFIVASVFVVSYPNSLHIALSLVEYTLPGPEVRHRRGLCSGWLQDLCCAAGLISVRGDVILAQRSVDFVVLSLALPH
jgi:sulfite reductase alpha subunit-like flavoprotein